MQVCPFRIENPLDRGDLALKASIKLGEGT